VEVEYIERETHCWKRTPVRDFHDRQRGAADGWTGYLFAGVPVHDDGDDDLNARVDELQHVQRFGEVTWILDLADEGEEGHVTCVGEDDV